VTHAEQLAAFVVGASFDNLSESARLQLKIRILAVVLRPLRVPHMRGKLVSLVS